MRVRVLCASLLQYRQTTSTCVSKGAAMHMPHSLQRVLVLCRNWKNGITVATKLLGGGATKLQVGGVQFWYLCRQKQRLPATPINHKPPSSLHEELSQREVPHAVLNLAELPTCLPQCQQAPPCGAWGAAPQWRRRRKLAALGPRISCRSVDV